jgi:hypothetical protein
MEFVVRVRDEDEQIRRVNAVSAEDALRQLCERREEDHPLHAVFLAPEAVQTGDPAPGPRDRRARSVTGSRIADTGRTRTKPR